MIDLVTVASNGEVAFNAGRLIVPVAVAIGAGLVAVASVIVTVKVVALIWMCVDAAGGSSRWGSDLETRSSFPQGAYPEPKSSVGFGCAHPSKKCVYR